MSESRVIIKNEKEKIKNKLKIWLEFIKKEKDFYKTINKFREIFKGEYLLKSDEDIEEDYYEEYIDTYYLKNKIKIVHKSGPQDKFGNMTSHIGSDLIIYSELSNNEKFAEDGVCIFYESEYQEDEIEDLEKLINENIGIKAIYGLKMNDKLKVTDIKDNGNYEDFGQKIVDFIKNTSVDKMKEIFNKIILTESLEDAVSKQLDECKKCQNLDIDQLIEKANLFRTFLKNTIGDLEVYRDDVNAKYMVDKEKQLYSTDFAYIIDLDAEKLDIYWQDIVIDSYELSNIPEEWIGWCSIELKRQIVRRSRI